MSRTVAPAEITISSILELMVENGSVSLVGNITSSISLKILYINCMNVVNISSTAVPFIGLSGVLKRTDSVLMVKPVRSLRRQIYNVSLEDHLEIELVALLFAARSHFRFPLLA